MGIVLVSHSAAVADGAAALAREMGGEELRLEPAGGLDEPDRPLGTDPALVAAAIERADGGSGVVVLMDLGSAVLSAESALELVPDELAERVVLSPAPLVEGAVGAAVAARAGGTPAEVADEARRGLSPKERHLAPGGSEAADSARAGPDSVADDRAAPIGEEDRAPGGEENPDGERLELRLAVDSPHGLHARPAARLVRCAQAFDARAEMRNLTEGRGPVDARSFADVATLGVRGGQEVLITATGPQARPLLDALEELVRSRFGESGEEPATEAPGRPQRTPSGAWTAPPAVTATTSELRLEGMAAAPGLVLEPARRLRVRPPSRHARVQGSPEEELEALDAALDAARGDLAAAREETADRAGRAAAGIFDAHLLVIEDEGLVDGARRMVAEGREAGEALERAVGRAADRFRALEDPYLQARADDVEDAGRRVLDRLAGTVSSPSLEEPGVLVAEDLSPSEVADLDPDVVRAVATARGAPTSHAAVLARALGVPAVVGLGPRLLEVPEGAWLLMDGTAGEVVVEPGKEARERHEGRVAEERAAAEAARRAAHEPAVTRDGRRVAVTANATSPADARSAVAAGAEGVGLLRTEFLFHGRESPPTEGEQEAVLREIAEALEGRPLVVRTLDAGADKPLPYLPRRDEENPFLGLRGLRLSLAEPELLVTQLRAVLRVAADHALSLMFPMVTTLAELHAGRGLLSTAAEALEAEGVSTPHDLAVGAMIEVPAAALAAERLAAEAAFLSIGTNDLAQYTLAAERGNADVAALGDALAPPVLELVAGVVAAGERHGRKVSVCGELAADPQALPVLVGLGVGELSVAPAAVPAVKATVRALDGAGARVLAAEARGSASAAEVRDRVDGFRAPDLERGGRHGR